MPAEEIVKPSELTLQAFKDYPEFATAYKESYGIQKSTSNKEQLLLYGLAKIGADEPHPGPAGMFNMKEYYKRKEWTRLLEEEKKTPEQAREEYIALVKKLKEANGFDPSQVRPIKGIDV